ncbi:MAG: DUF3127 domain-containing protein [Porphyromonas sp.]|nr:DUF3127 domain-containing protein [Porphyromonas sp.]
MNEMNNNSITGKITHVLELQSGDSRKRPGEKWYKQEYVLETFSEWPRQVCFQLWGEDRIKQANIQMDDVVTVQFELSSREYNGRWYTNVDGRFVTKGMPEQNNAPGYGQPQPGYGQQPNFGPQAPASNSMPQTDNQFGQSQESDDLPF